MRRFLWSLLILVSVGSAHGAMLRVSVSGPVDETKTRQSDSVVFMDVSNIERMTVNITMEQKAFDELSAKVAATAHSDPGTTHYLNAGTLFQLTALDSDRNPVAIRKWETGEGLEAGHVEVTLLIEIPIDEADRRRQIFDFFNAAMAEEPDGPQKEWLKTAFETSLKAHPEALIAYFENMFVQNRVGDFILHVTMGDPHKPIAEAETRVHIPDNGRFMDKLFERLRASEKRPQ